MSNPKQSSNHGWFGIKMADGQFATWINGDPKIWCGRERAEVHFNSYPTLFEGAEVVPVDVISGQWSSELSDLKTHLAASEKYRAEFLWPHNEGSVEQAGYEFANGKTKEYLQQWWKILSERIIAESGIVPMRVVEEEMPEVKKKQAQEGEMSDPKFKKVGTPEVKVIEECAELIQAITKAQRFGWFNHHSDRPHKTNIEKVAEEIVDVVETCDQLGIIVQNRLDAHLKRGHQN